MTGKPLNPTITVPGATIRQMDSQLIQAVQQIARAVQPHFWPEQALQLALVILTGLTVFFLWRYTRATVDLCTATRDQVEVSNQLLRENAEMRKAARDQVEVGNRLLYEAQIQNETAIRPILQLQTTAQQQSQIWDAFYYYYDYEVVNLGNGPAFSVEFEPMHTSATPITLGTAETIVPGSKHGALCFRDALGQFGTLTPLVLAVVEKDLSLPASVVMRYKNASGKSYHTTLMMTQGPRPNLFQFTYIESSADIDQTTGIQRSLATVANATL